MIYLCAVNQFDCAMRLVCSQRAVRREISQPNTHIHINEHRNDERQRVCEWIDDHQEREQESIVHGRAKRMI